MSHLQRASPSGRRLTLGRSARPPVVSSAAGRRRLGSPVISVNQSGRYLRQRILAEQERRVRHDRKWRLRVWIGGICIALYVLIGRDLIGMTWGLGRAASADVRQDIHDIAVGMEKIAKAREQERKLLSPSAADRYPPDGDHGNGDPDDPTTWQEAWPQ